MRTAISLVVVFACGPIVACATNQTAVDPTAPSSSATSTASATATATSTASASASTTASATDSASATASASAPPSAPPQPGSPVAFQSCSTDADCVAVAQVGCCQNGRMEAIATSQVDAYKASFTCPPPRPMCPMYMMLDTRQPECNDKKLCEMVPIEKIQCAAPAKHKCPDGYACRASKCVSVK